MDRKVKQLMWIGILIQVSFILIGFLKGQQGFFPDNLIFILILVLGARYFKAMKLNTILYSLGILYMVMHASGVFDAYNLVVFSIPYDKIIHFVGFAIIAMIFCRWFYIQPRAKLFFIVFLAAMGLGAIVEIGEYAGFVILGEGDGFFFYGAGDGISLSPEEKFKGSWENAMTDMIANMLGVFAGLITARIISNGSEFS